MTRRDPDPYRGASSDDILRRIVCWGCGIMALAAFGALMLNLP